jgi:hypothetical protein
MSSHSVSQHKDPNRPALTVDTWGGGQGLGKKCKSEPESKTEHDSQANYLQETEKWAEVVCALDCQWLCVHIYIAFVEAICPVYRRLHSLASSGGHTCVGIYVGMCVYVCKCKQRVCMYVMWVPPGSVAPK